MLKVNKKNIVVISLSGFKGVGKDTFAKLIEEEADKLNKDIKENVKVSVMSLGFYLKEFVSNILNLSMEDIEEYKRKENFQFFCGQSVRDILVKVGEGVKNISYKEVWLDNLLADFLANEWDKNIPLNILVIPDLRYEEEYNALFKLFGEDVYMPLLLTRKGYGFDKVAKGEDYSFLLDKENVEIVKLPNIDTKEGLKELKTTALAVIFSAIISVGVLGTEE